MIAETSQKRNRLGCKHKHNRTVAEGNGETSEAPPPTSASDPVAAKTVEVGEFVLAEFTQTFDKGDATYFFPLFRK